MAMSVNEPHPASMPESPSGTPRRPWIAQHKALTTAGCAVMVAAAATSLAVVLSGPSYPHSWCGPVLTQLHAHETQSASDANMSALESQGAPAGKLISDGDTATQDQGIAANSGVSTGCLTFPRG
jgi:hypothetical protein